MFIAAGAVYSVFDSIFSVAKDVSNLFSPIAAFFAIFGLVIQIWIMVTNQRDEWLKARFAAERLRSIKFQSWLCALSSETKDDLAEKVRKFSSQAVAKLKEELNAGIVCVEGFDPKSAIMWTDFADLKIDSPVQKEARESYEA